MSASWGSVKLSMMMFPFSEDSEDPDTSKMLKPLESSVPTTGMITPGGGTIEFISLIHH
jgi:hypothetical protein